MLNPTHLRTFRGVVEAGSFSEAARRFGMTQPGVSQHIAQLEDELGTLLVSRQPRGIELLPAGQRLLEFARAQEHAEGELRRSLGNDDPFAGECRIASPGSFGLFLYPRLLDLQLRHPGLSIACSFAPNQTIRREVGEGVLDLGFVSGTVDDRKLAAERVAEETLMIVVPKGSDVTSLAELNELGFIGHPDGDSHAGRALRAHFGNAFAGTDMLRRTGFSNQIGLILAPVARGLGFTVLPDHAVRTSAHREDVDCLRTTNPIRDIVWAVWRGDVVLPARFRTVLNALLEDDREGH